jgi:hypothetical protein
MTQTEQAAEEKDIYMEWFESEGITKLYDETISGPVSFGRIAFLAGDAHGFARAHQWIKVGTDGEVKSGMDIGLNRALQWVQDGVVMTGELKQYTSGMRYFTTVNAKDILFEWFKVTWFRYLDTTPPTEK